MSKFEKCMIIRFEMRLHNYVLLKKCFICQRFKGTRTFTEQLLASYILHLDKITLELSLQYKNTDHMPKTSMPIL